MLTKTALLAAAAAAVVLVAPSRARAQSCGPCATCTSRYTDRHGSDNPASYLAEKQLFIVAFLDTVATRDVATWPQARAVWHALGERFRKQSYGPEDYIGNCTTCSCAKTQWCTEFVIKMYKQAGMTVLGPDSNNPVSSSRALFECVKDKYSGDSRVYYRKPSDTSFTPRPGDALVFQWTGNRPNDGRYYGINHTLNVNCVTHWNTSTQTSNAGYCSDHTGMVLGVVGSTLYTVEGNVSKGRVRIVSYPNYRSSSTIVAFVRINRGTIDCR